MSIAGTGISVEEIGHAETSTIPLGSAVSLTTATAKTVTSVALGAGDWDVRGGIDFSLTSGTTTLFQGGISLSTNTLPTQAGGAGLGTDGLVTVPLVLTLLTNVFNLTISPTRVVLAAPTTIYLVALATFSAGTVAAFGTILARRMG